MFAAVDVAVLQYDGDRHLPRWAIKTVGELLSAWGTSYLESEPVTELLVTAFQYLDGQTGNHLLRMFDSFCMPCDDNGDYVITNSTCIAFAAIASSIYYTPYRTLERERNGVANILARFHYPATASVGCPPSLKWLSATSAVRSVDVHLRQSVGYFATVVGLSSFGYKNHRS
jgi:hypothetical protein